MPSEENNVGYVRILSLSSKEGVEMVPDNYYSGNLRLNPNHPLANVTARDPLI